MHDNDDVISATTRPLHFLQPVFLRFSLFFLFLFFSLSIPVLITDTSALQSFLLVTHIVVIVHADIRLWIERPSARARGTHSLPIPGRRSLLHAPTTGGFPICFVLFFLFLPCSSLPLSLLSLHKKKSRDDERVHHRRRSTHLSPNACIVIQPINRRRPHLPLFPPYCLLFLFHFFSVGYTIGYRCQMNRCVPKSGPSFERTTRMTSSPSTSAVKLGKRRASDSENEVSEPLPLYYTSSRCLPT